MRFSAAPAGVEDRRQENQREHCREKRKRAGSCETFHRKTSSFRRSQSEFTDTDNGVRSVRSTTWKVTNPNQSGKRLLIHRFQFRGIWRALPRLFTAPVAPYVQHKSFHHGGTTSSPVAVEPLLRAPVRSSGTKGRLLRIGALPSVKRTPDEPEPQCNRRNAEELAHAHRQ